MKVLFAVSDEDISESIVRKYQKEYKQIISYKNVYYFNAILKELQKDKTYDRIVISEDLEAFTHSQYDQIDKFLFDKLDGISDEASNLKGNDIPIILICSERRAKSDQLLVKLFGIGVYNAILGNDRSVDEVCRLINRPRVKKEAKLYYQIDTEDVNYQAENENDVSEMEIQNIIAHYKKLGKNEERYVDSFNNIAAQYNDTQLRIISKFLPLNVRAVLEEKSTKYQQIMSFNNTVSNDLRYIGNEKKQGPSEKLLQTKDRATIMSKPVVIPSSMDMTGTKKLTKVRKVEGPEVEVEEKETIEPVEQEVQEVVEPKKRGRGRPRKNAIEGVTEKPQAKRGRGRPKKNIVQEEIEPQIENIEETILPGLDNEEDDDIETFLTSFSSNDENLLPGFEEDEQEEEVKEYKEPIKIEESDDTFLPGMEESEEENNLADDFLPGINEPVQDTYRVGEKNTLYQSTIDLTSLLTPDKKIVSFVGTSKNGTSFIVNNLAELLSSAGINVAILDTTKNRNSYYIYTKNEEELRITASRCIDGLVRGMAKGIEVNKNLTVYTSLPNENDSINNVNEILETLLKSHSLILIDTDFNTPLGYFKESQEIYLVQTYDVLTIQPLTAFLRELKAKNILEESKLRVILNKTVKIRGVNDKTIIGGMAYYNDPAMSFMTELFNRNTIKYVSIPLEEVVYVQYLQSIIECNISLKGYSKTFIQTLKELGNMIYPIVNNKKTYQPPSVNNRMANGFTPNMNNTLDQMKRRY